MWTPILHDIIIDLIHRWTSRLKVSMRIDMWECERPDLRALSLFQKTIYSHHAQWCWQDYSAFQTQTDTSKLPCLMQTLSWFCRWVLSLSILRDRFLAPMYLRTISVSIYLSSHWAPHSLHKKTQMQSFGCYWDWQSQMMEEKDLKERGGKDICHTEFFLC